MPFILIEKDEPKTGGPDGHVSKNNPRNHFEIVKRVILSNLSRICKYNQALIMGFGDNDHVIRGLIRFIEMTSRESIIYDVIRNGGDPKLQMLMISNSKYKRI